MLRKQPTNQRPASQGIEVQKYLKPQLKNLPFLPLNQNIYVPPKNDESVKMG